MSTRISAKDSTISRLRAGYRDTPLGLPSRATMLSWWPSPDAESSEFNVVLRDALTGSEVWNGTTERPWILVPGEVLPSRAKLEWGVESLGRDGSVQNSELGSFEMGLSGADDWEADWIAGPVHPFRSERFDPAPCVRHEFHVDNAEGQIRLYATALGLYRVWLNGVELTSDELLRPGWTDYRERIHHQTFDGTGLLVRGANVLAATLANGWYAGRLGLLRQPGFYGDRPQFLAQLERSSGPGRSEVLCKTGDQWTASAGSVIATDLIRGETVDHRREPEGWRASGFDSSEWAGVEVQESPRAEIMAQPHDSIRVFKEFPGAVVHEHARGPVVFDFGQNLVGWTRLDTQLMSGTDVIVRHGEILTPENLVYRDNLRGAFQEDTHIDVAEGQRSLQTSFTMHGFRYVEIWGLPSDDEFGSFKLKEDTSVTAIAIESGQERSGRFACSDERLTAFADAIEWTVRDNFLEVATDCPQRDERHGWLGDAGVIAPTASYFFDIAAFLNKFTQDAVDAQTDEGDIPSWVPTIPPGEGRPGSPGWSDGYVRMLSVLVRRYGDVATAERQLGPLTDFLDHLDNQNPDGLRVNAVGSDFADWLSLPESDDEEFHPGYGYTGAYSTSPRPVVGTAHSYRSFVQGAEIAARLNNEALSERLAARAEQIRQSYLDAFVTADGTIKDATQTVYAQAVGFGLLRDHEAQRGADLLRQLIEERGHVTTGIHGVEHVLPVLARHGHADLAIDLLLKDTMPSWLYMISKGATTVWEKWDAIDPDGNLATAEMNSFNHCALGGCGAFLFEDLLGLRVDGVAWDGQAEIRPTYTSRLDWVDGSTQCAGGELASRWERNGSELSHDILVPGGVTARFVVPEGAELRAVDGIQVREHEVVLAAGSHRLLLQEIA